KLPHQIVQTRKISACISGHEKIKKQADKEQHYRPTPAHIHSLHPHQDLPAHNVGDLPNESNGHAYEQPSAICSSDGAGHLRTLLRAVKYPYQNADGKDCLERADDRFVHREDRLRCEAFQVRTQGKAESTYCCWSACSKRKRDWLSRGGRRRKRPTRS